MSKARDTARRAAEAHTDVNVFHSIVVLLEGGTVYTPAGRRAAQRIIKLAKKAASRAIADMDRAVEKLP